MKFAILGTDSDILRLAAAARQQGHEFIWVGDVRPNEAEAIGQIATDRHVRAADWEMLLDRASFDGVFVGRGAVSTELRAEQVKRLAAEAMPMLVVHPLFESVLPYYEIDMARRETRAGVQHFNPSTNEAALARLSEFVGPGLSEIGTIHQLTCERKVPTGDRTTVLRALAQDVESLATIAGDIRRVSATGPVSADASFASLQIQLAASKLTSVRWSVAAIAANQSGVAFRLIGERGTVTLEQNTPPHASTSSWQLTIKSESRQAAEPLEVTDPAAIAVRRFTNALGNPNSRSEEGQSTWPAATRAMEVVDAVELSLQKGRTIEVFQQQLTERLAFRGTMAALGCGLLLIAFFAVVVVAFLGGAEGVVREKILPSWPLLLLAVLAFFLFLQAIPLLAKKSSPTDVPPSDQP